jgi:hypothetical protein
MITQFAFMTNVLLVFSYASFLAHLQLHISDYGFVGVVAAALIYFFPGACLVGCRPVLFCLGKSLF